LKLKITQFAKNAIINVKNVIKSTNVSLVNLKNQTNHVPVIKWMGVQGVEMLKFFLLFVNLSAKYSLKFVKIFNFWILRVFLIIQKLISFK
jgi:hypothetical protein